MKEKISQLLETAKGKLGEIRSGKALSDFKVDFLGKAARSRNYLKV